MLKSLLTVLFCCWATPAFAGVAKTVSVTAAQSGHVRVTVAAEGGGTILDFSATGETIKQLSIDDPSKIAVDHCLMRSNCKGQNAPIVRLFRVKIPNPDIPSATTTQLTVVTQDRAGQWTSYIFPVTPVAKPSAISKFVIGGTTGVRRGAQLSKDPSTSIASGLSVAQRRKLIVDPQLTGRVQMYLKYRQAGMSEAKAAQRAGISKALVQKLKSLAPQSVTAQPSQLDQEQEEFLKRTQ